MSKYYSIHEFSKIIGVSAQTLRNWDANGKLHPHQMCIRDRYFPDELCIINKIFILYTKNKKMKDEEENLSILEGNKGCLLYTSRTSHWYRSLIRFCHENVFFQALISWNFSVQSRITGKALR